MTDHGITIAKLENQIAEAMERDDWAEATRLGQQLEAMECATPPFGILPAALWYAEQGLKVFPLAPGSKIPHKGTQGFKMAANDPETVRAWWHRWPDSNVGIATGHLVDVIDIDGPAGMLAWSRLAERPQALGTVSTPRDGGTHVYVRATGRGNRAGMLPQVDYRGQGGYVVAAPSVVGGRTYHWRLPLNLTGSAS